MYPNLVQITIFCFSNRFEIIKFDMCLPNSELSPPIMPVFHGFEETFGRLQGQVSLEVNPISGLTS